jgi:hypothetical protein
MSDFPYEILERIICNVDAPTAVCLALTSRRMYETTLAVTKTSILNEICPRQLHLHPPRMLQLYYVYKRCPFYRMPLHWIDDACTNFGIRRSMMNVMYMQLMLNIRSFMGPDWVLCFARQTPTYVPRKARAHCCLACQVERRAWARYDLEKWVNSAVKNQGTERRSRVRGLLGLLQIVGVGRAEDGKRI